MYCLYVYVYHTNFTNLLIKMLILSVVILSYPTYTLSLINTDMFLMALLSILIWRCHQMKTFSALRALCAGNSPLTGEFPSQRPVTRSFDVSLICAWINGWVNNREAGDLRRHRAHCDVTVMIRVSQVRSSDLVANLSNSTSNSR